MIDLDNSGVWMKGGGCDDLEENFNGICGTLPFSSENANSVHTLNFTVSEKLEDWLADSNSPI